MASDEDSDKDDIRTQFYTREGLYTLIPHAEYCKHNRDPFSLADKSPVFLSFGYAVDPSKHSDKIAFNCGKEIYIYDYKGCRKVCVLV